MVGSEHVHQGDHDWHSQAYVAEWINRDVTRDSVRRPQLRQMLAGAGLSVDATLRVLDIGAGYAIVSEEVLHAFPNAHVTLHDFSEPKLAQARHRLDPFGQRVTYAMSDLSIPEWTAALNGPFDLAVSALCIHNLHGRVPGIYAELFTLLKPGGVFLSYDLVSFTGGLESHLASLRQAGFDPAEAAPVDETAAVLMGRVPL